MSLEFEMLDITIPRQQTISRNHKIPKLQLNVVEDFTPKTLEMFIHGSNKKQDFFLEEILREIGDFRSCYLEEFVNKYNDYEFARICSMTRSNTIKHLVIVVYLITRCDLYLLKNQVPFRVLKLLVKLRYDDDQDDGYHSFEETIKSYCSQIPSYLLDVFRRVLVNGSDDEATVTQSHSGIDSLKGMRFTSHYYYAKLKLPCWYVSTYTKVFFMNMIAYELCPNGPIDRVVVSYINVMKSLIIFNTLGSDEEVVQVYKGLKTYGVDDPLLFKNGKRNIQEHYNSKGKTWIAELIDTYFNSI
ncbi:hypothetical protein H5410_020805 [Solanum commersonii]|uniref:Uncharacterized protein n=1 Tax=Solanum commersonii TaxID=4109 RepID=A0A9J5ZDC9_SOLCO|nr:hypothetical protein H5410_020805 [Solanum commersonii]